MLRLVFELGLALPPPPTVGEVPLVVGLGEGSFAIGDGSLWICCK